MIHAFDGDALDRRDAQLIEHVLPPLAWLQRNYFRLDAEGREHVPAGPALFVANHNGGILGPDLFCTLPLLWQWQTPQNPLYALAHDFPMRQFTPLGRLLQKVGAIRASRANAARVLASGGQLLVYPGGDLDAYRTFSRRHEVVILPRSGFVEVARAAGVPIVPIVVRGAHESAVILTEGEWIARRLRLARWGRLNRFPIALALPWGVALGPWLPYLPLPLRLRLRVLPPMHVDHAERPLDAATRVQQAMQRALDALAA